MTTVMRKAVLMEDEGRESIAGTFPTKQEAQAWIDKQVGQYFSPSDYYIAESSHDNET